MGQSCYASAIRKDSFFSGAGADFLKSDKYTNVPGLRVLEFDQNFNAKGKETFYINK